MEFGERTQDCSPGHTAKEGPHLVRTGASRGYSRGGAVVKKQSVNAGDAGSIPAWGRSPEEGNGNPLQYCHLENLTDLAAWWASVYGVTKSGT